jgi:hypothetical protein
VDTHKLQPEIELVPRPPDTSGLRRVLEQIEYLRLPPGIDEVPFQQVHWQLVLRLSEPIAGLLALEIGADVVIGRGTEGSSVPHLDIADLQAQEKGVSRRHVLLRPTARNLYAIDLDSTNGTFVDGHRIWKEISHPLAEGNRLRLGSLDMTIVHLKRLAGDFPGPDTEDLPVPPSRPDSEDERPLTDPFGD